MKNKIYLIGDSFTDNLYKEQLFQKRMGTNEGKGQIRKYIDSIYEDDKRKNESLNKYFISQA